MVATGALTPAQEQQAESENVQGRLKLDLSYRTQRAPHFVDWLIGDLEQRLGSATVHQGGLAIYTTIDANLQQLAESAVAGGVGDLAGAGVNNGDLLAANPATGEILAWVGSRDYSDAAIGGAYDVVVSPRQPGSSFKPYVYMSALRDGKITWATCLSDAPRSFGGYTPQDFDGRSLGTISARTAILQSRNIPAVEVAEKDGIDNVIALARRMGIQSKLDASLPTAIGASDVTLFDQVQGYQVLADGGSKVALHGFTRVVDRNGNVVAQAGANKPEPVLSAADAYVMADVLKDYPRTWGFPWNRELAAKTGTTDNGRDAWVLAYSPDVVIGAWVGQTGADGKGGVTRAYGESVGKTVMARFVNGLPAGMHGWYQRPAGVVQKGGYDFIAGTENSGNQCASPGPGEGPGEGAGGGGGGKKKKP
jgi:membrane peptidoglycan carboxypeptidase